MSDPHIPEDRRQADLPAGETAGGPPVGRVLVTKLGLDGHDRGSRLVAAYLRDAGFEVIYTGPWQSVTAVTNMAIEEDVDVIGISSLATDHLLVPKLLQALKQAGAGEVPVVVGGIVPDDEADALLRDGVRQIFHPGASREDICSAIASLARQAQRARAF